jgi:hypothetical protein
LLTLLQGQIVNGERYGRSVFSAFSRRLSITQVFVIAQLSIALLVERRARFATQPQVFGVELVPKDQTKV